MQVCVCLCAYVCTCEYYACIRKKGVGLLIVTYQRTEIVECKNCLTNYKSLRMKFQYCTLACNAPHTTHLSESLWRRLRKIQNEKRELMRLYVRAKRLRLYVAYILRLQCAHIRIRVVRACVAQVNIYCAAGSKNMSINIHVGVLK